MRDFEPLLIETENQRLLNGGYVVVGIFDDHRLHFFGHLKLVRFPSIWLKLFRHLWHHGAINKRKSRLAIADVVNADLIEKCARGQK